MSLSSHLHSHSTFVPEIRSRKLLLKNAKTRGCLKNIILCCEFSAHDKLSMCFHKDNNNIQLEKMAAILKMEAILKLKMSNLVSLTLRNLEKCYHTRL